MMPKSERLVSRLMEIIPWQLAQAVYCVAIVLVALWIVKRV